MRFFSILLVGLVSTALVGCGSAQPAGLSSADTGFVAGDGSSVLLAVADRKLAPDISETTFTGKKFQLSSERESVVVINVWGSWCAPCRAEAQELADLARTFENENVTFLGINTRDSLPSAKSFVERFTIEYENIEDLSEKIKYYAGRDSERISIAKRGKEKYFKLFNEKKIAKFILDKSLGNDVELF